MNRICIAICLLVLAISVSAIPVVVRIQDHEIIAAGDSFSGVDATCFVFDIPEMNAAYAANPLQLSAHNLSEFPDTAIKADLITHWTKLIDARTDEILYGGFTYEGCRIDTAKDIRADYNGLAIAASSGALQYPVTIKNVNGGYLVLTDQDAFMRFYAAGLVFSQGVYQTGWNLKDSLVGKTIDELLIYQDPR